MAMSVQLAERKRDLKERRPASMDACHSSKFSSCTSKGSRGATGPSTPCNEGWLRAHRVYIGMRVFYVLVKGVAFPEAGCAGVYFSRAIGRPTPYNVGQLRVHRAHQQASLSVPAEVYRTPSLGIPAHPAEVCQPKCTRHPV
eukprot:1148778-Pelagomonas_calceolata.AAC.4